MVIKMITFDWIFDVLDVAMCFLCKERFEENDIVGEFFGGLAHWECLDKKFEENKKRRLESENKM